MARIYFFTVLFFLMFQATAQYHNEAGGIQKKTASKLSIESFSYPLFLNGEEHSNFVLGHRFDDKFRAELQGFYDTYLLADVIRFALRGKYYAGEKFYFFSGVAAESERNRANGRISSPSLFILNGAGYDINKKINLEVKHELQLNKTGFGNYSVPNLFSVHGKYKF